MKRCQGMLVALLVGLPVLTTPAFADVPPSLDVGTEPPNSLRYAQWVYDSPLCVEETITDAGQGRYLYTYSFLNVDDAHIWHFGIWVTFASVITSSTWDGHPEWGHEAIDINEVADPYDGRNLDPNITFICTTWGPNWPNTTDPINPGEYVTGFSYTTGEYDPNPEYYFYETVELGWAQDTGYLAAVGMTSVGPSAAETSTWGKIKLLFHGN